VGLGRRSAPQPVDHAAAVGDGFQSLTADDSARPLPNLMFEYRSAAAPLRAAGGSRSSPNNETNAERLYGSPNVSPYVKDAFHRHVVDGERAVNPTARHEGGVHFTATCRPGLDGVAPAPDAERCGSAARRRIDRRPAPQGGGRVLRVDHPPKASKDEKLVQRQALAGMLWTKQIYLFDVTQWLQGDNPNMPPPASRNASATITGSI
jgi:hypothetical protein